MKNSNSKKLPYFQQRAKEKNNLLPTISQVIAKRKQAEKVLRESEIRYRRLFEADQDGTLILDVDFGAIADANPFGR